MKIKFSRKEKKEIRIEDFNSDQNFCCDCGKPINKNCHKSDKMEGKCGKCFRLNFTENERRKKSKNIAKKRNEQRIYKDNNLYN